MTTIVGTLKDSAGAVLSGKLKVKLAAGIVDNSTIPDSIFTEETHEFTIENGVVNLTLPETESSRVSMLFEFYLIDSESNLINPPVLSFSAIIPNLASVELSQLTPTGIVKENLDSGALRIARLITNDISLVDKIKGGPYPQGPYNEGVFYKYGDLVSYQLKNYISKSTNPIVGILPTNSTYWYHLEVEPEGSTYIGDDSPFDSSWNGDTIAPSKNVLYDELNKKVEVGGDLSGPITAPVLIPIGTAGTIKCATVTLDTKGRVTAATNSSIKDLSDVADGMAPSNGEVLQYNGTQWFSGPPGAVELGIYAKLDGTNSTFTVSPLVPTPIITDNSTKTANTTWVNAKFSPLTGATFTGSLFAPTAPIKTNTTQVATTAFVQNTHSNRFKYHNSQLADINASSPNADVRIFFKTNPNYMSEGSYNPTNGNYVIAESAWYQIFGSGYFVATGGTPPSSLKTTLFLYFNDGRANLLWDNSTLLNFCFPTGQAIVYLESGTTVGMGFNSAWVGGNGFNFTLKACEMAIMKIN